MSNFSLFSNSIRFFSNFPPNSEPTENPRHPTSAARKFKSTPSPGQGLQLPHPGAITDTSGHIVARLAVAGVKGVASAAETFTKSDIKT